MCSMRCLWVGGGEVHIRNNSIIIRTQVLPIVTSHTLQSQEKEDPETMHTTRLCSGDRINFSYVQSELRFEFIVARKTTPSLPPPNTHTHSLSLLIFACLLFASLSPPVFEHDSEFKINLMFVSGMLVPAHIMINKPFL